MAYELTYSLINNDTEYSVTGYTGEPIDVVIPSIYNGKPVITIGSSAFAYCDSLTSVDIPDSVTTIGDYAFSSCSSLTSVEIPDSVTTIGERAFDDCDSLTSIVIPDSVTSIGDYVFYACNSLTSVVIGDSVTSIGDYAFASCNSLTSVEIPDSVTTIGGWAFYDCSSLTSIKIPDGVTSIGDSAFSYCDNLTSVVIPDSVTTIGEYAFASCSSLTSITLLSKTPANLAASNSFDAISANAKFYCLSSAIDTYKTATNWNSYANNFVADDMRLYFTMNSRAQKKYFANKEDLEGKSNIGHTHSYETIGYTGEPDSTFSDPEYWSLDINNGLQIKQEYGPGSEKIQITPLKIEAKQGDNGYNGHGDTCMDLANGVYSYTYSACSINGSLNLELGTFECTNYSHGYGGSLSLKTGTFAHTSDADGVGGSLSLQAGTFSYKGIFDTSVAELNLQNSTLSGSSPQVNGGSTWTLAFPNTDGTLATQEWTNNKFGELNVTYAELVNLRDSGQLVPGRFYRITDYVCTTIQADTRAMNNKFDIIVQALSNCTLSENASADYHENDTYFVKESFTIDPSVLGMNSFEYIASNTLKTGAVQVIYREYLDSTTSHEYSAPKVDFVCYNLLENNQGKVVPVLYKRWTNDDGLDEIDNGEPFYYLGQATIDGVVYDKWKKLEGGIDSWSATNDYYYTNIIVKTESEKIANLAAWELKYCLDNDKSRFDWADYRKAFRATRVGYTNHFMYVRCPGYDDAELGRKAWAYLMEIHSMTGYPAISVWPNPDTTNIIFTNTETVSEGDILVNGAGKEFTVVGEMYNPGKGVIYYMKDEWNNECPYDFKNIQFLRDSDWDKFRADGLFFTHNDLSSNSTYWCYTFSWINEDLKVEDLTMRQDLTADGSISGTANNKMAAFCVENVLRLNNNVIINTAAFEGGQFYGCNNNTFGADCCDNTLGSECDHVTFGNSCYFNILSKNCRNFVFEGGCYNNKFFAGIYDSVHVEADCGELTVSMNRGEWAHHIRICQGMRGKNIYCDTEDAPTIYRASGTKEIILE